MEIRLMGTELFRADGQTDRETDTDRNDEANGRFSQFCKRASMHVW